MRIVWDVPAPRNDGIVRRADAFLPVGADSELSVILNGSYAKALAVQVGYPSA
jgi:hypothetical protein